MKRSSTASWQRLVLTLVLVLMLIADIAQAQLPDCTTGFTMYAVFNNLAGSTTADSTEIRSVNVTTGAIGSLVAGRRYWIRKRHPTTGTWYYGTSALGVDLITQRFYVMTQMSSAMQKDIITINPISGAMTVIGTTPSSLNNYHFVKLAIANDGYGYAIGVNRDSTQSAATCNPLIRFTPCGASPSAGCSTIELLGYLPSTGSMYKWLLFNGDIAFDVFNNMYFATAAFEFVAGIPRYTDARLFRVAASDIPTSAGTGTIPMSFVADYNTLDSTVINGIGLDPAGAMYFTTRRFTVVQTNPAGPSNSELYTSPFTGFATQVAPFAPITANFSVADLGSCYFPQMILGTSNLQLTYKYEGGNVNLKWQAKSNPEVLRYEVQRSNTGNDNDFETIGTIIPGQSDWYTYADPQNGFDRIKFYRVRQVMNGRRFYSNMVKVTFNNRFTLTSNIGPNPFAARVDVKLWMRTANTVNVRMLDQSGRTVYVRQFSGKTGDNKSILDNLSNFKAGVYVVEVSVQEEVIREKIIKQ